MSINFIGIGSNHTLGLTVKFDKSKYESVIEEQDSEQEAAEEEVGEACPAEA